MASGMSQRLKIFLRFSRIKLTSIDDISAWDTSKAKDMSFMFDGARAVNQDFSSWCTGNVVNMEFMFSDATSFDGDISSWDLSSLQDMDGMFVSAQPVKTEDRDGR